MVAPEAVFAVTAYGGIVATLNLAVVTFNALVTRRKNADDKEHRELEDLQRQLALLTARNEQILKYRHDFREHRSRIDTTTDKGVAASYRHDLSKFMESLLAFYHQGHFCDELCEVVHDLMRELDRVARFWPKNEGRDVLGYAEDDFCNIQRFFREHPEVLAPPLPVAIKVPPEAHNDQTPINLGTVATN